MTLEHFQHPGLIQLRHEKQRLLARLNQLQRAIKRFQSRIARIEVNGEQFDGEADWIVDIIENFTIYEEDLRAYLDHVEAEIKKVVQGITALETLSDVTAITAFTTYIEEDIALSLKTLRKANDDYAQIMSKIKEMEHLFDE